MSGQENFHFGNGTCSTIEYPPFEAICAKPAVTGSEPLSLEVPVPMFAPTVPPAECACFSFTKAEAAITVTKTGYSAGGVGTGTAAVAIQPATDDCCNGSYSVTPTISLEIPECSITGVTDSQTSDPLSNLGGSITVTLKMENCVPKLELAVNPIQIAMPSGGSFCLAQGGLSVGVKYKDSRNQSHTVNPPDEPNLVLQQQAVDGCWKYGGSVTLDLGTLDIPGFGNGGDVDLVGGSLYIDGDADSTIKTYYCGRFGDWKNPRGATHSSGLVMDYDKVFGRGPLMRYAVDGSDPSPVLAQTTGHTVPVAHVDTFFAVVGGNTPGGIGQSPEWQSGRTTPGVDGAQDSWESWGNLDAAWPTGAQWDLDGLGIAMPFTRFVYNDSGVLSSAEETKYALRVSPGPASRELQETGGALTYLNCSGLRSLSTSTEWSNGIADGLRVDAGDGLRIYGNGDGSVASDDAAGGVYGDSATGYDESRQGALEVMYGYGLHIRAGTSNGVTSYLDHPVKLPGALEVMYGPGFKMHDGTSGNTTNYVDDPKSAAGALVPNDGRGLRVHGVTKKNQQYPNTNSTESYASDSRLNQLEVHTFDWDIAFQNDGRLVLNDNAAANHTLIARRQINANHNGYNTSVHACYRGGIDWGLTNTSNSDTTRNAYAYKREDYEYTVPVLVPLFTPEILNTAKPFAGEYYLNGKGWYVPYCRNTNGDTEVGSATSVLENLVVMFLHVSRSGLVLGVDTRPDRVDTTHMTRFAAQ